MIDCQLFSWPLCLGNGESQVKETSSTKQRGEIQFSSPPWPKPLESLRAATLDRQGTAMLLSRAQRHKAEQEAEAGGSETCAEALGCTCAWRTRLHFLRTRCPYQPHLVPAGMPETKGPFFSRPHGSHGIGKWQPHPIHPTLTLDNGAQTWRSSGEPQEGEGSSAPWRAPEHTLQQLPAGESRLHSASLPCSSANTHCRCLCLFSRKIWRPYIGTLLARSRWRKHLPVPPRAHPHPGASVRGR